MLTRLAAAAFFLLASACAATGAGGGAIEQSGLPDPLTSCDGGSVSSAEQWMAQRRPEILETFRTEVFGRAPVGRPADLRFRIVEQDPGAMGGAATMKRVAVEFGGPGGEGRIDLVLFVPNARTAPAPAFLLINHRGPRILDATRQHRFNFWPAEEIVARGYAAVGFNAADADPDRHDGFRDGVHGIFDGDGGRDRSSWGTLAAWAWAASRALDYLETDPDVDAGRVALVGHSRGGKAALWAGADDQRFAMVVSNNSGTGGAALSRGNTVETVEQINSRFPHWFSEAFKAYGGRVEDLPVDQHMLLALIAPRALYVASASDDVYSDVAAEWGGTLAALPVFGLFGLDGTGERPRVLPEPGMVVRWGAVGYHMRPGRHALTTYDWHRFMDFADERLGTGLRG